MLLLQQMGIEIIAQVPITTALVITTLIVSYQAFKNEDLYRQLIFNAAYIRESGQWYRFFSAGLLHANWMHLAMNLFVLWEFGKMVEMTYMQVFGQFGRLLYLLLYVLGLGVSSIYSYFRHRYNRGYSALGASGAVSAVVFAFILFYPLVSMRFMFFPFVDVPAVLMGAGYLAYSQYMSRRGGDNIGHDAHFWGSVWGLAFTCALNYRIGLAFIEQLQRAIQYGS